MVLPIESEYCTFASHFHLNCFRKVSYMFRLKDVWYWSLYQPFERIVRKLYIDILRLTFSNVDPLETTKSFCGPPLSSGRQIYTCTTSSPSLCPTLLTGIVRIAFSPLASFDWFRVAFHKRNGYNLNRSRMDKGEFLS